MQQPTGYRAFVPKPLSPTPALRQDAELASLLSAADHRLGRLDGVATTLPNPDLFVTMFVHKEAVLSSRNRGDASLARRRARVRGWSGIGRLAGRRRRGGQLRSCDELRPGSHQGAAAFIEADEGDSPAAAGGRPWRREGAWRVQTVSELGRPVGHQPDRGHVRAAFSRRHEPRHGRPRELPP